MLETDSYYPIFSYEYEKDIIKHAKSDSNMCKNDLSKVNLIENNMDPTRNDNICKLLTAEMGQDGYTEKIPAESDRNQYIVINLFRQQGTPRHSRRRRRRTPNTPGLPNVFIQCVMLLTFAMYMFTAILVFYILITPDVINFMTSHAVFTIILSILVFLIIDFGFIINACSRRAPCNFYMLAIMVMSLSTIIATVSALFNTKVLLYAIISIKCTSLVGAFLSCTKFNFSSRILYAAMLGTALSAIFLIVMVILLVTRSFVKFVWLLVLIIVTFVQVAMSTMRLQSILRRKTIKIKEDDYALGAFMLYAAAIDVFLKLLQISRNTRNTENNR